MYIASCEFRVVSSARLARRLLLVGDMTATWAMPHRSRMTISSWPAQRRLLEGNVLTTWTAARGSWMVSSVRPTRRCLLEEGVMAMCVASGGSCAVLAAWSARRRLMVGGAMATGAVASGSRVALSTRCVQCCSRETNMRTIWATACGDRVLPARRRLVEGNVMATYVVFVRIGCGVVKLVRATALTGGERGGDVGGGV